LKSRKNERQSGVVVKAGWISVSLIPIKPWAHACVYTLWLCSDAAAAVAENHINIFPSGVKKHPIGDISHCPLYRISMWVIGCLYLIQTPSMTD